MAVSSTRGSKKTVDGLVLMAYKRAGLVDVEATSSDPQLVQKLSYGRELLDLILDQLANIADVRFVDFYDVTCVASTQAYTLPEEIIDVIDDGVYMPASETDTEEPSTQTFVKQIDRARWNVIPSKNSTGTPTQMYPHRGVENSYQISLKLWPIPTEAGTVRIQAQRAPADALVGSDTIDVKSAANAYLLHELAAQLCESGNGDPGRVQRLTAKAMEQKREMRIFAAKHAPTQIKFAGASAQRRL